MGRLNTFDESVSAAKGILSSWSTIAGNKQKIVFGPSFFNPCTHHKRRPAGWVHQPVIGTERDHNALALTINRNKPAS